jgi:hypothetical protein
VNEYIKQLEQRNEELTRLLADSQRREEYIRHKFCYMYILDVDYDEETSFSDGGSFTASSQVHGIHGLHTEIHTLDEYRNNCKCNRICITCASGTDFVWTASFVLAVNKEWRLRIQTYHVYSVNFLEESTKNYVWLSFREMQDDIIKYITTKAKYEQLHS